MDKKIVAILISTAMCMNEKNVWIIQEREITGEKENFNKSLTKDVFAIYNNQVCMNYIYEHSI